MLGIWTWGRRMVGAVETTELWNCIYCQILIVNVHINWDNSVIHSAASLAPNKTILWNMPLVTLSSSQSIIMEQICHKSCLLLLLQRCSYLQVGICFINEIIYERNLRTLAISASPWNIIAVGLMSSTNKLTSIPNPPPPLDITFVHCDKIYVVYK